jgi:hypothetical protein
LADESHLSRFGDRADIHGTNGLLQSRCLSHNTTDQLSCQLFAGQSDCTVALVSRTVVSIWWCLTECSDPIGSAPDRSPSRTIWGFRSDGTTTRTRARESTAPVKANELPQQPRRRPPVGLAGLNLSTQVISSTAAVRQNCPPSHQPPQPVFETTCHKAAQPRRTTCQISTFPSINPGYMAYGTYHPGKHLIKPASSSLF